MRKRTRILAARLAACSLSAAMVFTALPPTAVTSYASALEVDLDVEASKEIIGKVGDIGIIAPDCLLDEGSVSPKTLTFASTDNDVVSVASVENTNTAKYTAKKAGTATVTVTATYQPVEGGYNLHQHQADCFQGYRQEKA